jgi:2-polyprenyl-3-methyl-5-hydroxy-6-metoxy-1,4-benzoquinol methylase
VHRDRQEARVIGEGTMPRAAAPRMRRRVPPACRCCGALLSETFADLGMTPLAGATVPPEAAAAMEPFWPLRAMVCSDCRLVQLAEVGAPASPPQDAAPAPRHGAAFARQLVLACELDATTPVLEVGSGDGSGLRHFLRAGVPVSGIEAMEELAEAAALRGIPTEAAPFGAFTARRLRAAGCEPAVILAGDALGQAADPHDVAEGFRILLPPGGMLVLEFPHLLRLIAAGEFDAIHHGRVSYLSLTTAETIMAEHGLVPFDAEELPQGGGILRLRFRHQEDLAKPVTEAVMALRAREAAAGLGGAEVYRAFGARLVEAKCALLDFLVGAHRAGRTVAGHGAPARGVTLLNYCGVGPELLPFTVDADPRRQGTLLPGTRIPIRAPEAVFQAQPDFLLILPWDQRQEITQDMRAIRRWGGRFVVPIPTLQVL